MNLPSQDSIAEFQTWTAIKVPDYGVGSGGTIVMVLKSGSGKFHGELCMSSTATPTTTPTITL